MLKGVGAMGMGVQAPGQQPIQGQQFPQGAGLPMQYPQYQ